MLFSSTFRIALLVLACVFGDSNSVYWDKLGEDIDGEAAGDRSGWSSVSLSDDGSRVAVGAPWNDQVNGNNTGHCKVYKFDNGAWEQLGGDIDGAAAWDRSGTSVSLNGAGTRVAVGAPGNNNNGDGDVNTGGRTNVGTVLVWKLNNENTWIKYGGEINGEAYKDQSGISVSLSDAGTRVAVGAWNNTNGVNNYSSGHVRVYVFSDGSWEKMGAADIDGETVADESGYSVSLSGDGMRVAVGAHFNDGNGTNAGHVRVYKWAALSNGSSITSGSWEKMGSDIDGERAEDRSGGSVSLSDNGQRVAVGARFNDDGPGENAGHARVYMWSGAEWVKLGDDIDGTAPWDMSGVSVALSGDGTRVAVGAHLNDNPNGDKSGHVRVHEFSGGDWVKVGDDIDGEATGDFSGRSVSLSDDGKRVAVGAPFNDNPNGADSGHARVHQCKTDGDTGGGTGTQGDPHLHLAGGGKADFRGVNATWYPLLSAPDLQFAVQTIDSEFMMPGPRPQFVHGSFITSAAWTVRGESGNVYHIMSDAGEVSFRVTKNGAVIASREGGWKQWWEDGVRVYYKQSTVYVRANGWEVNATRHPIYNRVAGPKSWRFDAALRPLDGTTGLEATFGAASKTCFPHGLIAQSFDGDNVAVDGATDDYTYNAANPVVTTKAMAEGAIEGVAAQYALTGPHATDFAFSRFDKAAGANCAPRDVKKLTGFKHAAALLDRAAGSKGFAEETALTEKA